MNIDFGFGYDFSLIQDRFKNIHSKHYWPLCPQCKKFLFHILIYGKKMMKYLLILNAFIVKKLKKKIIFK